LPHALAREIQPVAETLQRLGFAVIQAEAAFQNLAFPARERVLTQTLCRTLRPRRSCGFARPNRAAVRAASAGRAATLYQRGPWPARSGAPTVSRPRAGPEPR